MMMTMFGSISYLWWVSSGGHLCNESNVWSSLQTNNFWIIIRAIILVQITSIVPHHMVGMNISLIFEEFAIVSNFDYSLSHMTPIKCEHFVLRSFFCSAVVVLKLGRGVWEKNKRTIFQCHKCPGEKIQCSDKSSITEFERKILVRAKKSKTWFRDLV